MFMITRKTILSFLVTAILATAILLTVNYKKNFSEEYENEKEETESGADKQLSMFFQRSGYPDPSNITDKWMKAWEQAQIMKLKDNPESRRNAQNINQRTAVVNGNWTALGPKVFGGRILCLAFDPVDPNTMYAGSASGGIWKTTTGGVGTNAWVPLPTGFPVLGVSSIIIDPNNRNTIYAGTGEVYRVTTGGTNIGYNVWKARGTYGIGILKSINGGLSWTQVFNKNMSDLFGVQKLVFNPRDANKIYAATTTGLYRTINAGTNWVQVSNKINVRDVSVNYNDTAQVVMSVGDLMDADKGIYKSTNSGATFIETTPTLPSASAYRGFVAFANIPNATIGSTLYASIDCGTDFYSGTPVDDELYRSTDFGTTWSMITGSSHRGFQYWFCSGIAINPSATTQLILGGVDKYRITVSGTAGTKTSIGTGAKSSAFLFPGDQDGDNNYVHADLHQMVYHPSTANKFYIACDGGIFMTTNNGTSFQSCNGGLQVQQFYGNSGYSSTNADVFVGGLQDNGLAIYRGAATGWRNQSVGDGGACAIDQSNNIYMYGCGDARNVNRSTNTGSSFASILGRPSDSRTGFIAPMALSKSNPNVLYIASDNLHKNTAARSGSTFTNTTPFTNYIAGAAGRTAVALEVSPTNENKVYVSTSPFSQNTADDGITVSGVTGLWREDNTSTTPYSFVNIKSTLPDRFVMDFAISSTDDNVVYVVLGGYGTSHVYKTINGGTSWTNIDNGQLPDVPTNAILIDATDPNVLYVGNDLGVYVSPDGGTNWYDYSDGLWDATQVYDIVPIPGNKIRAITHGKGIFESATYNQLLPSTFIDIAIQNKATVNTLKWLTQNEFNIAYYAVERSLSGTSFSEIKKVNANNSNGTHNYTVDDDVAEQDALVFYYRIKTVDRDSKYAYSKTVSVKAATAENITALTNPVKDKIALQVKAVNASTITLNIVDLQGRTLLNKQQPVTTGTSIVQINESQVFLSGTYIVEAIMNNKKYTFKILKQ
jgi:hypothetical protein